jgi:hypothetical protein
VTAGASLYWMSWKPTLARLIVGRATTAPTPLRQPVAGYVEQLHSTASLAREQMPAAEAAAFDQAVADIVAPYAADGVLHMTVTAQLTWGRITA